MKIILYEARVSMNNDMNPNRIQSYSYWNSKEKVWNSERELRRVILTDGTMEDGMGHSSTAVCRLLKKHVATLKIHRSVWTLIWEILCDAI